MTATMSKKDYYEVLEIPKGSNAKEIKSAYRKLAMKYHPDRNPDNKKAEESFKEIQEAYAVLSDDQKRAAYDQFGHAGVDSSMGGGGGYANFNDVFGDIFGDIFGSGRGGGGSERNYAHRGADLRYQLTLTLEEAVHGCTQQIRIPTLVECKDCHGSGAKKGTQPTTCKDCNGMGQVRIQQGFFSIQQTCPSCHGQGKVITSPCPSCHGHGRVQEAKTLSVKIPARCVDSDRYSGAGD